MEEILVSIICLTYNHEKFIKQTLDGFVMQKTDFRFEVIVHDDASTDNTANIIKQYEKLYPDIIHGIYQTTNQYSKKTRIYKTYIESRVRGKYVALCEGDDFWCASDKLQKQVEILEEFPNCHMCVHRTKEILEDGRETGVVFPQGKNLSSIIDSEHFLAMCQHYSFHTSSYMFRAIYWKQYICNPPEFYSIPGPGDEKYLMYFGQLSSVCYINEIMSAYRRGVDSSWTKAQADNISKEGLILRSNQMLETLRLFDEYTKYKYHNIVVKRSSVAKMKVAILSLNAKEMFGKETSEYFQCLSLSQKIYLLIACFFPKIIVKIYLKRLKKLYSKKGY